MTVPGDCRMQTPGRSFDAWPERKGPPLDIDWHGLKEVLGNEEFIRQVFPLVKEIPPESLLAQLTPKQRRELRRLLRGGQPADD